MIQDYDMQDIAQMKEQLYLLKKKLGTQRIVNEKMIQQAMKTKLYKLNKMGKAIFIVGLIVAFSIPNYFYALGCSKWFCAATFAMLVFCAIKTRQYHKGLWITDITGSNLIEVGNKVSTLKRQYKEWQKIAIPMASIWFIWLCIEAYQIFGEEALWFCGSCAIGGIIGGLIGTRINKNVIRTADSLLEQIKDYKEIQ